MVTVDGATLLQVFEHSVKDFSLTRRHGKFLQVSGIIIVLLLTILIYNINIY